MAKTARDLCTEALRKCDAIATGETPDNIEIVDALNELNDIIDSWNMDNLWPYTNRREEWTIDPSTRIYSIGEGADIDTARPLEIQSVYIDFDTYTRPLRQIDTNTWDLVGRNLNLTSIPDSFVYRPDFPNGVFELNAFPDRAYTAFVQMSLQITTYGLNDVIDEDLPPGYYGALKYALATALGIEYEKDVSQISQVATSRLARIKRQNYQPNVVRSDFGQRNRYNIYTDTFDRRGA